LRLFSFGGYGLALAALALVVFGAYDSYLELSANKRQVRLGRALRPAPLSLRLKKSRIRAGENVAFQIY